MRKIPGFLLAFFVLVLPALGVAGDIQSLNLKGLGSLLEANRGKIVLVNFFATWCPPCRIEIGDLVKIQEKYKNELQIVGLSVDTDSAKIPPFVSKMGIGYQVFQATNEVPLAYGVSSIPHNVFYGKNGEILASAPGLVDGAVLEKILGHLLTETR